MIYLDNAATSFPKPSCMLREMERCIRDYCGNPGRSGHELSVRTGEKIYEARNEIASLFGVQDPSRILLTSNTTEGINMGLKGVLNPGDHVITTSMEHNSVLRPLKALEWHGIQTSIIKCDECGRLNPTEVEHAITPSTRLIVCTHVSNVTGTIIPIAQIGKIAKKRGILFMVDAAQSAGTIDINIEKLGIDLLAAPGHKGLLGPQGTGILYIKEGIPFRHFKEGGTGTDSKNRKQPVEFPEGYESGTLNSPGIIGLGASVKWIKRIGIKEIHEHEMELLAQLYEDLSNMRNIEIYGPKDMNERSGIITINIEHMDCEEAAASIWENFRIAVRGGYHCAGLAHRTIGTWNTGAIRISVGPFNTRNEIRRAIDAIYKLAKKSYHKDIKEY
jgi:cysteine desulfurase/selenocysteine lyase